ncbi:dihydropteroate synthase [Pedobacter frigiditerrae]|uniref:dihydropteroate synthase n=1 Tax=Pedobacter frigiditerrae TaxID=2530452 RepID=A0A4R0N5C0_9SPHI|nr:dihydropteroate synthase [Pedobacter frigiditerrae]TCC94617.1 dihydropteroate synthase [Pedobacter frigiditerrae]
MAKDTFLNRKVTLNSKGKLIDLSAPAVMAILNITPDSFYGNSRISNVDEALKRTEKFIHEGAKFIDIGAYSSRPGAADVSEDEELQRLIPIVEAIVKEFPETLISIDTFRAKAAKDSINAGAHLINDISAGNLDSVMFETVAKLQVPYVMMHMKGTPQNMQQDPTYENVTLEVLNYFSEKISTLKKLGVKDIIIDPGFGFAKTITHNYEVLQQLQSFSIFELPILVGFSRKSMITKVLNNKSTDALNGTSILNTAALLKGASILRVHDVKEAIECIKLTERIKNP